MTAPAATPTAFRLAEIALEDVSFGANEGLRWAALIFRAIERTDESDRAELAAIGRYLVERSLGTVGEDFKDLRTRLNTLREVAA